MEKINLNGLYHDAVNAKIAALREKAENFVEKEAIPFLVEAAKMENFPRPSRSPLVCLWKMLWK